MSSHSRVRDRREVLFVGASFRTGKNVLPDRLLDDKVSARFSDVLRKGTQVEWEYRRSIYIDSKGERRERRGWESEKRGTTRYRFKVRAVLT